MTDAVTAAHATSMTSYDAVQIAGDAVYWIEGRPDEGGRDVLVRWRPDGGATEPLPPGYSVGTHIYGYGGGAYRAWSGGVFFSSATDGSVCASTASGVTTIVPPSGGRAWYGDLEWVPRHRLLVAVRETTNAGTEVSQVVAVRPGTARTPHVLAEGADFYAAPRASPDGRWLAWLSWDLLFDKIYWGFFLVAGALFVLAGLAAYLAARWFKRSSPPTPEMAIDEAQRIRETLSGEPGGQLEAAAARAEAERS